MTIEIPMSPEIFFTTRRPFTDHDDTMAASKEIVTEYYYANVSAKKKRNPKDIQHYHKVREWALEDGFNYEEATQIEFLLWMNPDVLYQAKPVPGACEVSCWFYEHKIGLPVLTSRMDYSQIKPVAFRNMRDATVAWYEHWMPWVPADDVYLQGSPSLPSDIFKAWFIRMFKIGSYFEDSVVHAGTILTYTDAYVTLLSDNIVAQHINNPNLVRIQGVNGKLPDLRTVADYLYGR